VPRRLPPSPGLGPSRCLRPVQPGGSSAYTEFFFCINQITGSRMEPDEAEFADSITFPEGEILQRVKCWLLAAWGG